MNVQPLQGFVLVELLNEKEGGILSSVEEKQFKVKGKIISLGPQVTIDIQEGDTVIFEDYGRIRIPEDETYALIKSDAIVGKYNK